VVIIKLATYYHEGQAGMLVTIFVVDFDNN